MHTDTDFTGKAFETKRDILNMLKERKMTVSEISNETGLSKATISQHMKELVEDGKITPEENSHFKRTKYFRIRKDEGSILAGASKYIIVAVIIVALASVGAISLRLNTTPIPPTPTTGNALTTVSVQPSSGITQDCIMLPIYSTANYSSLNRVVGMIAQGSYCYLGYVNLTSNTISIGSGVSYSSSNGTIQVQSLSYVYVLNATDRANLVNRYAQGNCLAGNALRFFGINETIKVQCKAMIYN